MCVQVAILCKEHSIYPTRNGRIALGGITLQNVERVVKAIKAVQHVKAEPRSVRTALRTFDADQQRSSFLGHEQRDQMYDVA